MDFGTLNIFLNIASVVIMAGGVFAYSRSKIPANTILLYQQNQAAQAARLDSMGEELRQARSDVAAMQEEIRIIKTLPLESITQTLAAMLEAQNSILKIQNQILHYIETTPSTNTVNVTTPSPVAIS